MKYGKKRLLLLVLLVVSLAVFSLRANAQTSNYDVTVNPVFFDLTANPGDNLSEKVRIRNNTTSPLPIKLEVKAMVGDANGNLVLKDKTPDNSLSWISFKDGNTFIARPLEWNDVNFTVNIPSQAAYGYYFAISFTQDNNSPLAKTGAKITGAAAVPILLNVKKEGAKISGEVSSFTTDLNWYEYPPIKFSLSFQNTGNVHIRPTGNIFIKDFLGKQVATLTVNNAQGAILPDTKKTFEASWDDSFITREPKIVAGQVVLDKNGKPQTNLKINWTKILDTRIGKYTATAILVLSTPSRDIPYQQEVSFWVIPWKLLIASALFIIFAVIGFFNTFRNLFRRIAKIFRRNNQ